MTKCWKIQWFLNEYGGSQKKTIGGKNERKQCQKRMSGKKMNIYDALDFSEGASYAVMCYNLYGNGTEPGTKSGSGEYKSIWWGNEGRSRMSLADVYFY